MSDYEFTIFAIGTCLALVIAVLALRWHRKNGRRKEDPTPPENTTKGFWSSR